MSYNNNWAKELKEAYLEEKKAIQVVKKGAKVAKEVGKRVVKALGTKGGSAEAMHLGKGGIYDHVEQQGNDLQEEIALNEHLLMLIDILCEELGIDVEDLLSEDFTTAAREDELTQGVLSAVSRGDHSRAKKLVNRLDDESADNKNVYGKGGKKLKKAAGFRRVPGARKSSKKSK
jgi:hypothetical protein